MLHTKLLLHRLARVPWLLAASLVLGWSGMAAAQTSATISLTAAPTVISEDAGATDVVLTATLEGLDGKVFGEDVVLPLVIGGEGDTAARDVDYRAALSPLTIPAGLVSGTTTLTITPYNDKRARGDKTIKLRVHNNQITAKDAEGNDVNVTVGTVDITLKDAGASSVLSFDEGAAIYDQTYIVGRAVADGLPEALGGTGELTYSVSGLPAGLSFDAATRTISGTPSEATDGAVAVTYRVTDESGATITQTFTITIVLIVEDATISLTAAPTVISEDAGPTDVLVTATLDDGKVFDDDVVVFLRIDEDIDGDVARRDVDYTAELRRLTIPAGSVSGTTTITITPRNDKRVGANKTIRLTGAYVNTVAPVDITLKDAGGGSAFSFAANATIADQTYIVGTAIAHLVLPAASGGTGELTYSVSGLPAGLSFDAATRTLAGTPTAATNGAIEVTYKVTDDDDATDTLTFTITIVTDDDVKIVIDDDVKIVIDDDAKILLTVNPTAISEDAGPTDVVVTGTLDGLDGQVFDDDVVMLLAIDEDVNGDGEVNDDDKAATRDDYTAELRLLTIPPGSVSGTTTLTITPINDKRVEGDETIRLRLTRTYANNQVTVQDAEGNDVKMTVVPVDITLQDTGEGGASFFAADAAIDDYTYTAGATIADLVLPEASGGTEDLTYGVSGLPTGLSFDATTRTLSGTPTAATNGAVTVVYTATDESGTTDTLVFTITIAEAEAAVIAESEESAEPENPSLAFADDAAIDDQTYTADWPIADLVLPEASGGTGELTYGVSALPAGLAFDASTRTLSGTPTAATTAAVTVIYTVIDEDGNAAALTFTITVNSPLSFGPLLDLSGAGKVVPTASHD